VRTLPEKQRAHLKLLRVALSNAFGVRLQPLRVFGSWAWGEPHAESDVDLSIVVDGLTREDRNKIHEIVNEVCLQTDEPLAPLIWSNKDLEDRLEHELLLAEDIVRKGIVV
jgi:predicted nucleotidyltransferase